MDKEFYFEMLQKKDEKIQELKGDIYLLEENVEFLESENQSLKNEREMFRNLMIESIYEKEELQNIISSLNRRY